MRKLPLGIKTVQNENFDVLVGHDVGAAHVQVGKLVRDDRGAMALKASSLGKQVEAWVRMKRRWSELCNMRGKMRGTAL